MSRAPGGRFVRLAAGGGRGWDGEVGEEERDVGPGFAEGTGGDGAAGDRENSEGARDGKVVLRVYGSD